MSGGKRMLRSKLAISLAAVGVLATLQSPSSAARTTSYEAPFAMGPTGGDRYSYVSADPSGDITMARAYPAPGPISCPGKAGYANLSVKHKATSAVKSVTVDYANATVEPFTYLTILVRDAKGGWLGGKKLGGANGAGSIVVPVSWGNRAASAKKPQPIEVLFGLEMSSACPSANGGTIRYTNVTVTGVK